MFRSLKTFVVACSSVGLIANVAYDAQACGGRGGGGFGGAPRAAYQPSYANQQYCPQSYQRPVSPPQAPTQQFPQAGYQQLNQNGQFQGKPVQSAQLQNSQLQSGQLQGQSSQVQVRPLHNQTQGAGQQFQGGQAQSQIAQGQPVQGGQTAQTQLAAAPSASQSALSALGGDASIQSGAQQQPVQPQQSPANATPQQSAPGDSQVSAPAEQPQSPEASASKSAENDALQALLGTGVSLPAPTGQQEAVSTQTSGQFRASVTGGATVQLNLNANGTFQWVATKDGKPTSFAGNYSLQNGSLTLQRGDNQKLEGTVTFNTNGFSLRLAGQKDNGLEFVRG